MHYNSCKYDYKNIAKKINAILYRILSSQRGIYTRNVQKTQSNISLEGKWFSFEHQISLGSHVHLENWFSYSWTARAINRIMSCSVQSLTNVLNVHYIPSPSFINGMLDANDFSSLFELIWICLTVFNCFS